MGVVRSRYMSIYTNNDVCLGSLCTNLEIETLEHFFQAPLDVLRVTLLALFSHCDLTLLRQPMPLALVS